MPLLPVATALAAEDAITRHSAFRRDVHTEVIIEAPAEAVWAELTNFTEMPTWSRSLQGIEGELRPGSQVVVMFMDDKEAVRPYHHELVVFEDGRAFGWSDPIIPGLRDAHVYRVTPLPDGRTLFTNTDSANGFMSLFLGDYATNFMLSTYPVFNRGLKERVEARLPEPEPELEPEPAPSMPE